MIHVKASALIAVFVGCIAMDTLITNVASAAFMFPIALALAGDVAVVRFRFEYQEDWDNAARHQEVPALFDSPTEMQAEAARTRARDADLIVTNHALLAIHVQGDVPVLPDHGAVAASPALSRRST